MPAASAVRTPMVETNLITLVLIYPLVIAGLAALVRLLRPGWMGWGAIGAITLPAPLAVLGAAAWGIAALGPAPPGEIDATGMALAVYAIGGSLLAAGLLVLGVPAGWLVLRRRERAVPPPVAPREPAAPAVTEPHAPATPPPADATVPGFEALLAPPSVRLQGDGWEPHVEDVAGRLIYGFPVASGHATGSFAFPIAQRDVAVLLTDPYRRAALEVVTHTVFQRSMIRGNPEVTEAAFHVIVDTVLHASADELAGYLAAFDREHNIGADSYIRDAMARHAAAPKDGPCVP